MNLTDTPNGYVDRYNQSDNWAKILFNPNRQIQVGELIEIQSIVQDQLKRGFNTLFKNGSVIEGLQLNVLSNNNIEITLSITEGSIYTDGLIINIPASTVSVPVIGTYNIGIAVSSSVVTELDNPALRNPDTGGARYGTEGAHRLVINSEVVVNGINTITIGRITNGSIFQIERNPFKQLESVLSNYIYEKSGNFCVNGLQISQVNANTIPVADSSNYNRLLLANNEAESNYFNALSSTNAAADSVNNLTQSVNDAERLFNLTPIATNLDNLNFLTQQKEQAERFYDAQLRDLNIKQEVYQRTQSELDKASSLLVDRLRLSVEPGVAYILGKRIELSTASLIDIPKELGEEIVESAVFTYSGSVATSLRTLSLQNNLTLSDVILQEGVFELSFDKILFSQQYTDLKISFDLTEITLESNTISSLIDFIIDEVNKLETQPISTGVTYSSVGTPVTAIQLRNLLKSNIVIKKQSDFTLRFEATSLSTEANQIRIDIYTVVNGVPINSLVADVPSANLNGASRNTDFQLGFRPVKEIISLVADVEENQRPIVRGSVPGTADVLGDDSILSILSVVQGTTTFVEGEDYTLIRQSEIQWLDNNEPASGTTYYVTYIYTQPLAKDRDYILDTNTDSIVFIGKTPARNYTFRVSYSYFLAREGIVFLDSNGLLNYVLSSPSRDPVSPNPSEDVLPLAKFRLFKDRVDLTNYNCKSFKFEELRDLIKLTKDNVINLSNLKLNNQAFLSAVKQIDADPIDYKANNYISTNEIDLNRSNCAFSFISNLITTNYNHVDVPINYENVGTIEQDVNNRDYAISLDYEDFLLVEQSKATKAITVNKINTSSTQRGKLYLSNQRFFYNKELKNVIPCDYVVANTSLSLRQTASSNYIRETTQLVENQLLSILEEVADNNLFGLPTITVEEDFNEVITLATNTGTNNTFNRVYVTVEDLRPLSDGYRLFVGGQQINNYTLTDGTVASLSVPNAMRATAEGTLHFNFPLPSLGYGAHTVEVRTSNGYAKSSIYIFNNLLNHTLFTAAKQFNLPIATGFKYEESLPVLKGDQPIQQLVINNQYLNPAAIPALTNQIVDEYVDLLESLHQSFTVPLYCYLTRISLKFKAVSNSGNIKLIIREVNNKRPSRNIYGVARLQVLTLSPVATVWTNFVLDYPILLSPLKEYCFSISSEDEEYEIFVSTINERDLLTNELIGDQLYLDGDLYESTDGLRVKRLEETDLTYRLYIAEFNVEDNLTVNLGSYNNLPEFNILCLNTRDLQPLDTEILYEYRGSGGQWSVLDPNLAICLPQKQSSIDIRARLSTTNRFISPRLQVQDGSVSLYNTRNSGVVISSRERLNNTYNNAALYITVLVDDSISYAVDFNDRSTDSNSWIPMTEDTNYSNVVDAGLNIRELRFIAPSSIYGDHFTYRITFSTNYENKQPLLINSYYFVW